MGAPISEMTESRARHAANLTERSDEDVESIISADKLERTPKKCFMRKLEIRWFVSGSATVRIT